MTLPSLILTADLRGLHVCSVDLRVQMDHELVVLSDLGVALGHLLVDPPLKALTAHSEGHVDEPLTGHSQKVRSIRHVISHPGVLGSLVHHLVDRETRVEGDEKVLDVVRLDDYSKDS